MRGLSYRCFASLAIACISLLPAMAFAAEPSDEDIETPEVEDDSVDDVPLLAAPRAGDQMPPPVTAPEAPQTAVRALEIGPDFGLISRTATSGATSYGPSVAWGVHARAGLSSWLSARLLVVTGNHEVTLNTAMFGAGPGQTHHPLLNVLALGARLEPTVPIRSDLRLWLALGANWERLEAKAWRATDATLVPKRTGVMIDYAAGLGSTWEVWPNQLDVTLSLSVGALQNESGTLFETAQAFTRDGRRLAMQGLSTFSTESTAFLAIGVIP